MASYNPNNQNIGTGNLQHQSTGTFSKILQKLSNWGMDYDNMVAKNRVSVGINEDPNVIKNTSMYDFFSQRAVASILQRKSVPYLDRAYADKRRILREYSIKDTIRDYITKVCDEFIIYDDEDKFCSPKVVGDNYSQDIKDKYMEAFENIYNSFGFSDGKLAWDYAKAFLIDGYLTFEIIYDDKSQNIIGFERMDSGTIVPGYEPNVGHIWIQYPEDPQLRRIILDSKIIHISYKSGDDYGELSYVENLIRPYNQLKLIEQTRIMFNMANATHYQKFTVPIDGLSRQRAEEEVSKMIADYHEEVDWDDSLGTVEINGSKKLPYNKQVWFPKGESGEPDLEIISPEGHDLNEDTMLEWFHNNLKRESQIPFTRFDKDSGGGNLYGDASEMTRDEVQFSNFISRLRTTFKELINKPLRLQMLIDFPELKNDTKFLNQIGIEFRSKELFEEWKRLNNQQKRIEIAEQYLSSLQDEEGVSYFSIDYVVNNILKLSEKDKQENESYKKKKKKVAPDEDLGDMDMGDEDLGDMDLGGDEDLGGGDEDFDF